MRTEKLSQKLLTLRQVVTDKLCAKKVTPLLCELHCLRILERITFKLSCLVFRSLNSTAPVYVADSIKRSPDVTTRRRVCVPAHQRRSLFQWLIAARSGIALSRLLLPVHGTANHRLSRCRCHCWLLSVIWTRKCSLHSDANSSSPSFLLAEYVDF